MRASPNYGDIGRGSGHNHRRRRLKKRKRLVSFLSECVRAWHFSRPHLSQSFFFSTSAGNHLFCVLRHH